MNPAFKKILVPVDLSESSLNALNTAVIIAEKHGAYIQILNVIEPLFISDELANSSGTRANEDVLMALAGSVERAYGMEPEVIQKKGNVVEAIIHVSEVQQSDLIIMGTHGASGYRVDYIGSNTYNTIKHARCSVLTVPPQTKVHSFEKITFPVRPVSGALSAYNILCNLISSGAALDIIGLPYHTFGSMPNILDKIVDEKNDRFIADKITIKSSWVSGKNIAEDVLDNAYQNKSDLIVITSGIDVITKPNFIGPHAQIMINASKVPLLIVKKIGQPVLV